MTAQSLFSLKDEVAVVTGGAQGLGEQMAIGLAEAGAHVIIADLNLDNAKKVAQSLEKYGIETMAVHVDVTQKSLVENMVDEVIKNFQKIDILVTSAGVGQWVPAAEMPESDWKRVMDINLNGTFFCCQSVGRRMIEKKKGSIITISSMSGLIVNTPQCQSHYNTSKGGVIMLTKSLAAEWAPYGVRVNSIAPGYMKTQLVADLLLQYPEYAEAWTKLVPFGRFGKPEEMKGPCVFLASNAASFVTGSVVVMDGGYTIW
ncbi:SDR family NAD(P)-dependent oxidoreductase [Atribacter laminatus]|uniref:Gluconate 5-dehydrogenase n=1 Tax=Atribacter laminatus TaxID=2847778 RepID=A0A7T1F209_ATRLM|nr:glucose 1-dehydrogenase [Atribacter laminatus]QPM66841.1 Gluconate 5-dehydrogenase [Atribacter laminatus]